MFLSYAEVVFVIAFTCSTNADYSDAVQALQFAVYDRCASREHPWPWHGVVSAGGATLLQTRVSGACIRQRRLCQDFEPRELAAVRH